MSTRRSEAVGVTQHKAKPDAALLPLFCTSSLGTHVRADTYKERTRVLVDNVTRILYSCYIHGIVATYMGPYMLGPRLFDSLSFGRAVIYVTVVDAYICVLV